MRIQIVCPAPAGSRSGNRITAERWARLLRGLGHRVRIAQRSTSGRSDLLIALHARRSAEAVLRFRAAHPECPVVVALTGTDLYRDLRRSRKAQRALREADRLVALQPRALDKIPAALRRKARVIYQSAEPTRRRSPAPPFFDVAVVGHLRRVKDPFRAALASRRLPPESRIRILHAGAELEPGMAARARAEARHNLRYRWLGELTPAASRRLIARSRLLVLSSWVEGGANVISEAVVSGVPVLASRIEGNVGLLGAGYGGYFPAGNTGALARLLRRSETDARFYARLKRHCARLAPQFNQARERAGWEKLLGGLRRRQV
ncbi:MAG TPA: selenoneine biosynthesis selenosugar synthase SenB [Candidatus Xenobia bacterium]|nr:selenoneine biosynthesis selenosugar synthase SenB [Candidatus Xenobia bacterium]